MKRSEYNIKEIENKWKKRWKDENLYRTDITSKKNKYYVLDMFPYPSGAGLHVGHIKGYSATDIVARYKRLKGFEVLHPMGWDSFGLPTENFAIKTGKNPKIVTEENTNEFKKELINSGVGIDWDREITTSDPDYYKFNQIIFLKLYKKGLAYKKKSPVNWCPSCKTVLSNEQSVGGICERCGSKIEIKNIDQWFFKITDYADRLLNDNKNLDWPESTKKMQEKWIGKSIGVKIKFKLKGLDKSISIFTTKPETIYGTTFIALAPENKSLDNLFDSNTKKAISEYRKDLTPQSEVERKKDVKTGVFTNLYAINPTNNELIPIWVADYILMEYGTGAIMGVPAHDKRDMLFAQKHNIKIEYVLNEKKPYEKSIMIKSDYKGMNVSEARKNIVESIKDAEWTTQYKLRDWLISRERFWGTPIPIIYCKNCGEVPVDEKDLPVLIPDDIDDYRPTGKPPLEKSKKFTNVKCPKCKGNAKREAKTMDTFVDSSWYFLRFIDNKNTKSIGNKEYINHWLPVDLYIGGNEHAVGHLLYSRFITKFLYDEKILNFDEPFTKLRHQGLIYGEDKRKMSKRWGNVVTLKFAIEEYGADAIRMYEMFMAPFKQYSSWETRSIIGINKFLTRIWNMQYIISKSKNNEEDFLTNELIKTIENNIEKGKYNICVSEYMKYVNRVEELNSITKENLEKFLIILSPYAPFITEEIWEKIGNTYSIHKSKWPEILNIENKNTHILIPIQINGKFRGEIYIEKDSPEEIVLNKVLDDNKLKEKIKDNEIKKVIYIKNKILNIVI